MDDWDFDLFRDDLKKRGNPDRKRQSKQPWEQKYKPLRKTAGTVNKTTRKK